MTRPPDRRSSVAAWLATSHGLRLGSGVSIVPSRIVDVRIAAAVSDTQASTPHVGSYAKKPSHPAASASAASSAASAASPAGITYPYFMTVNLRPAYDRMCPCWPPSRPACAPSPRSGRTRCWSWSWP